MAMSPRLSAYLDQVGIQVSKMVLMAAYYEDSLTIAIGSSLGLNEVQCNALVRPLGARAKLDLCDRLVAHNPDAKKAVAKHTRRARRLFDDRNAIIHGTFVKGTVERQELGLKSYAGKHKLVGKVEIWTLRRVSDLTEHLFELRDGLGELQALLASALQGR